MVAALDLGYFQDHADGVVDNGQLEHCVAAHQCHKQCSDNCTGESRDQTENDDARLAGAPRGPVGRRGRLVFHGVSP